MLVSRRSRRARLLGACARVRLATLAFTFAFGSCRRPPPRFRARRPSAFPSAFTTKSSWPRSPFRVYRARLSGITGNTSSAHSPRAREFVSRFDEGQRRSSSLRRSRLHLAPGNRARPRLSTMAFALPYSAAFRARLATFTSRSCRTLTRFEHARLATSLLETSHRCACVHLSFRTNSRSPLKPPLPCPHLAMRKSRSPLQRSDRPASLDAHDPPALPCSRSRTCSCTSRSLCPALARLSTFELRTTTRDPRPRTCPVTSFDAVTFRLQHLRMQRPAGLRTSRNSAPFEHRASRDVEHPSISNTFRCQSFA